MPQSSQHSERAGTTRELRILELERQLVDQRRAAVALILGMSEAIAPTPEGREELAKGFEEAASQADETTAQLAMVVAQALRRER